MKTLRNLFLLCFLFLSGAAMAQPHYWTWVGYSPRRDWDKYFQELTDVGLKGVIMQAAPDDYAKVIPIAEKYGVDVYAWTWIMNNGGIAKEHPEWLDYNRLGESLKDSMAYVGYYKFLSPIIPGVRAAIAENIEKIAQVEGLKGISMDYCRYVDQILPTSLWGNYKIVQDKEYPKWDYGYHPDMINAFQDKYGYDPSKLEDPSQDAKWFQFRLDQVNEVANMVGDIAHKHGKSISASPFPTPEMSRRMVRQDWGKWNLDLAFPMIYHGFYYGKADWIAECVRECIKDKPGTEIYCGLHIPDFGMAGKDGYPKLTEAMEAAVNAGAKGIAIYTFDSLNPEQRAEMKAFIQKHP